MYCVFPSSEMKNPEDFFSISGRSGSIFEKFTFDNYEGFSFCQYSVKTISKG